MTLRTNVSILIALAVMAVLVNVAIARDELTRDQRRQARCGACHVVMRNLESIRVNSKDMTNKGPYGMETEVLIDEALMHVCGVSSDSLKTLGFADHLVLEECNDLIFQHDETFERLLKKGIPDPAKACLEDVPVCEGLDATVIPKPSVEYQAPKHPKDKKTASKRKSASASKEDL